MRICGHANMRLIHIEIYDLFFIFVSVRFLKMNPDIKSRFTEFKEISIDEINKSNGHPRRLMTAIENSIGSLDDPETFAGYVLELGRRHIRLRSKPTKSHVRSKSKLSMWTLNWSRIGAHDVIIRCLSLNRSCFINLASRVPLTAPRAREKERSW